MEWRQTSDGVYLESKCGRFKISKAQSWEQGNWILRDSRGGGAWYGYDYDSLRQIADHVVENEMKRESESQDLEIERLKSENRLLRGLIGSVRRCQDCGYLPGERPEEDSPIKSIIEDRA